MATVGNGAGRQGRLKSWKQIAAFFGTDERTAKRWEQKRGLPVHRVPGGAKATVYAEVAELETWLKGSTPPALVPPPRRRLLLAGAVAALVTLAAGSIMMLRGAGAAPGTRHQPSAAVADLYLQDRYNVERRSRASLNRAVQLFGEAIRRDPLYAEAEAGLASAYLLLREYADMPDAVAYPRARAAAQRALAIDGRLADAHAALAFVTFFYDLDFNTGLAEFARAVALDPASATAHHWYASALFHANRIAEALVQIDAAQQLEPQSQSILADKALILFQGGRAQEALALLGQLEAADPSYMSPHAYLAGIHLIRRDYPAYLREAGIAARLTGDRDRIATNEAASRAFAEGGPEAMFGTIIAHQRALYAAGREHAFTVAATYAVAGRGDEAMAALTAAARDRDPYMVGVLVDSRLASLRGRPDFQRLARAFGS